MKRILFIAMLFSLNASAQNPPLQCGTWQQGGILVDCDLYQGNYKMPKESKDCWVYRNTRPGYNFSYGWFQLECRPEIPLPLDDYGPFAIFIMGFIGVVFIKSRKLNFKP